MPDLGGTADGSLEAAIGRAPLVSAWRSFLAGDPTPFTIPGHKRRAARLSADLGRMLDADVPLYGGLDTVKLTGALLAQAESAAARLWGADWCRISTGGSTHANQAITLALGRPGDTVLVSRTAHRSTLLGLVLAGLTPVWLPVQVDERFGLPLGLSPDTLRRAVTENPEAVAVIAVEPGYVGTVAPVGELADIAHAAGIPLVVDQAWGAHLGFHPDYPPHALARGADAVVTSAHKALPAFSQAAFVLARTDRFDAGRLERSFDAGHTTSPAGAILASADACRALLAHPAGPALLGELAALLASARKVLRDNGYQVPGPEDYPPGRFDPAKLVIITRPSGRSGLAIESELIARGLPVEMADRDMLIPAISLLDDADSVGALVDVLTSFRSPQETARSRPIPHAGDSTWAALAGAPPPAPLTPREAFFAPQEAVPIAAAVGRVCAEVIAPYPPGTPVLLPGELITDAAVTALTGAQAAGTRIAYAADPTLGSVLVVTGPAQPSNAAGSPTAGSPAAGSSTSPTAGSPTVATPPAASGP